MGRGGGDGGRPGVNDIFCSNFLEFICVDVCVCVWMCVCVVCVVHYGGKGNRVRNDS